VDEAGGLRPLGDLLIARSGVALVAMFHTGAWFTLNSFWRLANYRHWTLIYGLLFVFSVCMLVGGCGITALKARMLLTAKRRSYRLRTIRLVKRLATLQEQLSAGGPIASREAVAKKITALAAERQSLISLPSWPTDPATLQQILRRGLAATGPAAVGLLKIFGVVDALKSGLGL